MFAHSYLNYGDIAWGSTTRTELKKLASKQRQAIRAIYAAEHTREKMEEIKVLKIYKLNIYQVLTFISEIKWDSAPAAFRNDFREISHRYPTGFSQNNFVEGNIVSDQTKFAVSSRGPRLWNRLLNQEQKNMAYISGFKNLVKTSLLYLENEIIYFWKIKDKNSRQKFRIKVLYTVYYLTHTAWGVTLSPTGFFDKCEQICNLLRICHIC